MRNRFDKQLDMLNDSLIEMGTMCEEAISIASLSLFKKDFGAQVSVTSLESEIYQKEREIESLCLKLFIEQQPVARDLRQISATLKIITDMKRIGNQATNISDISSSLNDFDYNRCKKIQNMVLAVSEMLKTSIDSYISKNLKLAESVIASDDIVDKLFIEIKNDLINFISKEPSQAENAIDLLMICKYLEKIGDHAENIARWIEFYITGEHKGEDL